MARDEKLQLRITPWPILRLPHPRALWAGPYRLTGVGEIAPQDPIEDLADMREVEVPHEEIYLRLVAVDLEDPEAILDFANTYGVLGVRANGYREFAGLPTLDRFLRRLHASWPDPMRRRVSSEGMFGARLPYGETLEEFRFGARWMRDLTLAWKLVQQARSDDHIAHLEEIFRAGEGRRSSGLQQRTGTDPPRAWQSEWWYDGGWPPPPVGLEAVAGFLQWGLEPALMPFHPRLLKRGALFEDALGDWGASLFSICALELYNHIVENAPYRICAREACRREFVRQVGRSKAGQHRSTGVKYCSVECSRAAAQKAFRDRKRQERERERRRASRDDSKA